MLSDPWGPDLFRKLRRRLQGTPLGTLTSGQTLAWLAVYSCLESSWRPWTLSAPLLFYVVLLGYEYYSLSCGAGPTALELRSFHPSFHPGQECPPLASPPDGQPVMLEPCWGWEVTTTETKGPHMGSFPVMHVPCSGEVPGVLKPAAILCSLLKHQLYVNNTATLSFFKYSLLEIK